MNADQVNRIARVLLFVVVVGGGALYLFSGSEAAPSRVLAVALTTTTAAPATLPPTTLPPTTLPPTTLATTTTVTTTTIPVDPAVTQAAAVEALVDAGLATLTVTITGGIADVTGVVPVAALETGGFFAYEDSVRRTLAPVAGISEVRTRLQLRGDEATLRRQLRDLLLGTPVAFNPAESALTEESRAVLDEAARIILASPGLRVLVAGHADSVGATELNEALSRARALAAVTYLVERGVPANRLSVAAYGELFPTGDDSDEAQRALNRRIDFEVAA